MVNPALATRTYLYKQAYTASENDIDVALCTGGAQNNYCSDVRTSKILGHLGLTVDVIRAQGRKDL